MSEWMKGDMLVHGIVSDINHFILGGIEYDKSDSCIDRGVKKIELHRHESEYGMCIEGTDRIYVREDYPIECELYPNEDGYINACIPIECPNDLDIEGLLGISNRYNLTFRVGVDNGRIEHLMKCGNGVLLEDITIPVRINK